MKNKLQRYDINSLRLRHGHKYRKYKVCLSIMMIICIKQHLSNIWSWIHEIVKKHWGWVEKKALLIKKACITLNMSILSKRNLCGTNFSEFSELWPIWHKSIPKKFTFQESFAKVDACKEIFEFICEN